MTYTLRASLRSRLTLAMRQRDREAVAVLRNAIAAIENAEAVPSPHPEGPGGTSATSSTLVAGAAVGVGATEAQRRVLGAAAERAVVAAEVALLLEAQQAYAAAGDAARGQSAAGGVALLHAVLGESGATSA